MEKERRNKWRKVCKCPIPVRMIIEEGIQHCKTCGNVIFVIERRKEMPIPKADQFKIVDKPTNIDMLVGRKAIKYKKVYDLFEALEILDSTKTIQTTVQELGYKNFGCLYGSLMMRAKKRGKDIGIVEKDGAVLVFNR